MSKQGRILVGCAGWALPATTRGQFPTQGTHLVRYAARFPAVEINSSFYRPHRAATYERWAASVPSAFRFSVKLPKAISHQAGLPIDTPLLDSFFAGVASLGTELGCCLCQLPPKQEFEPKAVEKFFSALRQRCPSPIVVEPRHASWFKPESESMLNAMKIARVAADPQRAPGGDEPGGWPGMVYYRLHGSPKVYYSSYSSSFLEELAAKLKNHAVRARQVWCIFDNTALGEASVNALLLMQLLGAAMPAEKGS